MNMTVVLRDVAGGPAGGADVASGVAEAATGDFAVPFAGSDAADVASGVACVATVNGTAPSTAVATEPKAKVTAGTRLGAEVEGEDKVDV